MYNFKYKIFGTEENRGLADEGKGMCKDKFMLGCIIKAVERIP